MEYRDRDDQESRERRGDLWLQLELRRIWADDLLESLNTVNSILLSGLAPLCLECPSPLAIQHSFGTCHLRWKALLHPFTDWVRGPCSMFREPQSVPCSLVVGIPLDGFLVPPTSLGIR